MRSLKLVCRDHTFAESEIWKFLGRSGQDVKAMRKEHTVLLPYEETHKCCNENLVV